MWGGWSAPPLPNAPPPATAPLPTAPVADASPAAPQQPMQYSAAQFAAMTPEQQYALQAHWQQWQKYQEEYAKWHAQYGEQYNREMAAVAAGGVAATTTPAPAYTPAYTQPQPPLPLTNNLSQPPPQTPVLPATSVAITSQPQIYTQPPLPPSNAPNQFLQQPQQTNYNQPPPPLMASTGNLGGLNQFNTKAYNKDSTNNSQSSGNFLSNSSNLQNDSNPPTQFQNQRNSFVGKQDDRFKQNQSQRGNNDSWNSGPNNNNMNIPNQGNNRNFNNSNIEGNSNFGNDDNNRWGGNNRGGGNDDRFSSRINESNEPRHSIQRDGPSQGQNWNNDGPNRGSLNQGNMNNNNMRKNNRDSGNFGPSNNRFDSNQGNFGQGNSGGPNQGNMNNNWNDNRGNFNRGGSNQGNWTNGRDSGNFNRGGPNQGNWNNDGNGGNFGPNRGWTQNFGNNSNQGNWGNHGGSNQGGHNQAGPNQGGLNQGGLNQGGPNQVGPNKGQQHSRAPELDEEGFDRLFRQWEQQFEDWKKANVNNPDRQMYERYEQEFERQRRRLIERRDQMRRRKMEQMGGQGTPSSTHSGTQPQPDIKNDSTEDTKGLENKIMKPLEKEDEQPVVTESNLDVSSKTQEVSISEEAENEPVKEQRKRRSRFGSPKESKITKKEAHSPPEVILLDDDDDDDETEPLAESFDAPSGPITTLFKKTDGIPGLDLVDESSSSKKIDNEGTKEPTSIKAESTISPPIKKIPSLFDVVIQKPGDDQVVRNSEEPLDDGKAKVTSNVEIALSSALPDIASSLKDPDFMKKITDALAKAQGKETADTNAVPPQQFMQQLPDLVQQFQKEQNSADGNNLNISFSEWQRQRGGDNESRFGPNMLNNSNSMGGRFPNNDGPMGGRFGNNDGPMGGRSGNNDGPMRGPFGNNSGPMGGRFGNNDGLMGGRFGNNDGPVGGRFGNNNGPMGGRFGNNDGPMGGRFGNNDGPMGGRFGNNDGPMGGRFGNNDGQMGGRFGNNSGPMGGSFGNNNGPMGGRFGNNDGPMGGRFGNNDGPMGGRFGNNDRSMSGSFGNNDGPMGGRFGNNDGPMRGRFGNNEGPMGGRFNFNDRQMGGRFGNNDGPMGGSYGNSNKPNSGGRFGSNDGPNFGDRFGGPQGRNFGGGCGNSGGFGPNNNNNRNFGGRNNKGPDKNEDRFDEEDKLNKPDDDAASKKPDDKNKEAMTGEAKDDVSSNAYNPFRRSSGPQVPVFDEPEQKRNMNSPWKSGPARNIQTGPDEFYQPMKVIDYQNTSVATKVIDYGHKPSTVAPPSLMSRVPGGYANEFRPVRTFDYGHASNTNAIQKTAQATTGPLNSKRRNKRRNKNKKNDNNAANKSQQQEKQSEENKNETSSTPNNATSDGQQQQNASENIETANNQQIEFEEISDTEEDINNMDEERDDDSPPPPPPPIFSLNSTFIPANQNNKDVASGSIFPSTAAANANIKTTSGKHLQMSMPSIENKNTILIDEIILNPNRLTRPKKICIILRGPPGSGKSYMARLIKEKECEMGGTNSRILSIDDYFLIENDYEEKCPKTGKMIPKTEVLYEYDKDMEETYTQYLIKLFKKTIADNLYDFIIIDCNNSSLRTLNEFYCYAKDSGFVPYIVDLICDAETCMSRNIHERSERDIKDIIKNWNATPLHYIKLDCSTLLENLVEMEDAEDMITENICSDEEDFGNEEVNQAVEESNEGANTDKDAQDEKTGSAEEDSNDAGEDGAMNCAFLKSKWENDTSTDNLARLDGTNKLKEKRKATMEDYLQIDDWEPPKTSKDGKKRVRWADIEEKRAQEKMRAIGFVVGQTDWKRMMDPNAGNRALNRTKFIERNNRRGNFRRF